MATKTRLPPLAALMRYALNKNANLNAAKEQKSGPGGAAHSQKILQESARGFSKPTSDMARMRPKAVNVVADAVAAGGVAVSEETAWLITDAAESGELHVNSRLIVCPARVRNGEVPGLRSRRRRLFQMQMPCERRKHRPWGILCSCRWMDVREPRIN